MAWVRKLLHSLVDYADLQNSVVNGMYAIGSVTGPIVGGAFAQKGKVKLFRLTLINILMLIISS